MGRSSAGLKFGFVCPTTQAVFESEKFRVVDNRGVTIDEAGNKTLDAKVALDEPCPLCGRMHVYPVADLGCPFDAERSRPV